MPHVPARLQPYGNTRCRHNNTKITNHAQLLGVARLQMEEGEEEEREGRGERGEWTETALTVAALCLTYIPMQSTQNEAFFCLV